MTTRRKTVTNAAAELDLGPVFHTRWAVQADLPGIAAVDAGFGLPDLTAAIRGQLAQRNKIAMVVEDAGYRVVGHFAYQLADANTLRPLWLRATTREATRELVLKLVFKAGSHRRTLVIPVAAECRTDTVRQLCRVDEIPAAILADALQDAGGADEWLLAGLRDHHQPTADCLARAVAFGLNFAPPKSDAVGE